MSPPVRLLALNWSTDDVPPATLHRICGDRIVHRGKNHQTLQADADKTHEDVIWKFIQTTESLSESEVDACVDMDVTEDLEQALDRAIKGCVDVLGVPNPSREKVVEAMDALKGYAVSPKEKESRPVKSRSPRYFALLPEVDLKEVIGARLELAQDVSETTSAFWKNLTDKTGVQRRPHVTIVHQNSLPDESELWGRCSRLDGLSTPPLFKMILGTVLLDRRIMAVTVEELELDGSSTDLGNEVQEFVEKLPCHVKRRLHITVGTRDSKVVPVEAKILVENWRAGKAGGDVQTIPLNGVTVYGRLKGLMG